MHQLETLQAFHSVHKMDQSAAFDMHLLADFEWSATDLLAVALRANKLPWQERRLVFEIGADLTFDGVLRDNRPTDSNGDELPVSEDYTDFCVDLFDELCDHVECKLEEVQVAWREAGGNVSITDEVDYDKLKHQGGRGRRMRITLLR